jgi:uncharacterized membrane protein
MSKDGILAASPPLAQVHEPFAAMKQRLRLVAAALALSALLSGCGVFCGGSGTNGGYAGGCGTTLHF